jgi:hypothetical protein
VDAYFGMDLSTPTWLNHDYGDGEFVDILTVDAYYRVEIYTPIFWVRLAKKIFGSKLFFLKN